MAVFISYSSRDRALLEGLLAALRQAREQVWLDEELGGGEAWWRKILEQIRACEVFIVAVSDRSFESKPCQAELSYAQALGKPILPVQVGAVRSLRVNPLAQMQMIDYQRPSIETGIALVSAVHARRTAVAGLPDPLPEEPAVPFAYLMRLASTIAGPAFSAHEQSTLLAELKAGLQEDGQDASARADITQLLCQLRDRPDVTYRTRTDVEGVLASLGDPAPAFSGGSGMAGGPAPVPGGPVFGDTGPVPMGAPPMGAPPGGPPVYGAPPRPAGSGGGSRSKWLIGAGAAAVVLAGVIGLVIWLLKPPPPPKPEALLAPAQLPSILLTTGEIDDIMGNNNMQPDKVFDTMGTSSSTLSNPSCLPGFTVADATVYQGSGYTAVNNQTSRAKQPDESLTAFVRLAAVTFPSADQARAFVNSSGDKWQACAGQTLTVTNDKGDDHLTFLDVTRDEPDGELQIVQKHTWEGTSGWTCQHALRTVSNAVVEAIACNDHMNDEGIRITDAMAAKIAS